MRNPWDAWASARGGRWYERWPDRCIQDARGFAEHWRRLAESFLAWGAPAVLPVRYEDLVAYPEAVMPSLAEHARLEPLDRAPLRRILRGIQRPPVQLPPSEVALIAEISGEVASRWGYEAPAAPALLAGPEPSFAAGPLVSPGNLR